MKHPTLIIGILFLVAACSSSGGGDDAQVCTEIGCACVFNYQCDEGLFCVDGVCAAANPLADAGRGDVTGADGRGGEVVAGDLAGDAGSADGQVESGELGDPCGGNGDCASGWCVDSTAGGYCTAPCDDGCPEGWVCKMIPQTSPDFVSVCVLDTSHLCQPCETDLHCGDAGDLCLPLGGGNFCGRDCTFDPCPEGYLCQEVDGGAQQCLPVNGSCDCDENNVGAVKGCQITNEHGTCFGEETCDPAIGWTGCTASVPADEICNGVDDDCDGQTDEDFEPHACEVANEHGVCTGVQSCLGAAGWVCTAKTPAPEACNGLDDDCDADVDEGFLNEVGQYAHVEHCGACGNSCAAKFAGADEVLCDDSGWEPVCVLVSCLPGYFKYGETTCLSEDSFLCTPCQTDEDCFGELSSCLQVSTTDPRTFCFRDCSGESDFSITCPEGYSCETVDDGALCMPWNNSCDCLPTNVGQTKACSQENEWGICFGQEVCELVAGWTGCTAPIPAAETCDGTDEDCDGTVDEDTVTGAPCEISNEYGTCAGVEICAGVDGVVCDTATPAAEICNGLDDDCNGEVDEGFAALVGEPPVLKYGISTENCGACGYQCPPVAHGIPACDITPPTPLCVVGSCDEGYFDYLGVACLPIPTENLCAPCTTDAECQGPADACIYGEPVGWCARDCAPGSIYDTLAAPCSWDVGIQGCCPESFECTQFGLGRQCVPVSGTCTCVEDGVVEACSVTNAHGACFGSRICDLDATPPGWTMCDAAEPAAEICNSVDDDCDGVIDGQDDSLDLSSSPDGGPDCATGPACTGSWGCADGVWVCDAQPVTAEVCNGLDDDCDGGADEDFLDGGLYAHPDHCGACGYDCDLLIPGAVDPWCALIEGAPTCITDTCAPGTFPYGAGTVCMTLPDNLCQPCIADEDCLVPGSACMDFGDEGFCGRDCTVTSLYGVDCPEGYSCEPHSGGAQCMPASGSCVCGPDTVGLIRSCTVGACAGQQVCQYTGAVYVFSPCSAEGLMPEVCDGQDNDCDGEVDEGFLGAGGTYDTDQNCGVCGNDCTAQLNPLVHHGFAKCDADVSSPACVVWQCLTETIDDAAWEWVDVNGVLDDGCECLRQAGNDEDPPDLDFFDGGEPGYPLPTATCADDNCDGIDGVLGDALFVSAAAPADGDGSLTTPFQTVQAALDAFAVSDAAYILVSTGVYAENLVLSEGVALHGGYAPDFLSRNIVLFETELLGVVPLPGDAALAPIHAEGIIGPEGVLVSGFTITGYDVEGQTPAGNGASSVAVYVLDSDEHFALRNCTVSGGIGGAGATGGGGATGFGGQSSGGSVLQGADGANAGPCQSGSCSNQAQAGGAGGDNPSCGAADGPPGGAVVCPEYNQAAYTPGIPGHDGEPGWNWTFDSKTTNSCYGHATEAGFPAAIQKLDGGDGLSGADGATGTQGNGCADGAGAFVWGLWAGSEGAAGLDGGSGQGGGAGGAAGGIDSAPPSEMPAGVSAKNPPRYKLGATGGGAGAGGCAGVGGAGGGAGGANIAVLVGWTTPAAAVSAPVLATNRIFRGFGGAGGSGGYGGLGGVGGDGGDGGDSQGYWIDFRAGAGGRGGNGGNGGGGGGGCGGPSFGVAVFHYPATWTLDYDATNEFPGGGAATGGAGGMGGPSGIPNADAQGASGAWADVYNVSAP